MSIRKFASSAAIYGIITILPIAGLPIAGTFYANITPSLAEENSTVIAAWPLIAGINNSAFTGDPSLQEPASIKLTKSNEDSDLRFSFASNGASSIYIGYKIDGKTTEGWHNFNAGERITVRIPGNVDNQTIWVSRDLKLAPFKVEKIEIIGGK